MVEFACKRLELRELIKCCFSMNKTEYSIFSFLLDQSEGLCTSVIAEMMGKDRTTIQKSIKVMFQKNIVTKHQINLKKGGYIFVYAIREKDELKKRMHGITNEWFNSVTKSIDSW